MSFNWLQIGWEETNPFNIREYPYTDISINAVCVVPQGKKARNTDVKKNTDVSKVVFHPLLNSRSNFAKELEEKKER